VTFCFRSPSPGLSLCDWPGKGFVGGTRCEKVKKSPSSCSFAGCCLPCFDSCHVCEYVRGGRKMRGSEFHVMGRRRGNWLAGWTGLGLEARLHRNQMEGKRSGMEFERASVGQRDNESVCGCVVTLQIHPPCLGCCNHQRSTAEAEGPHGTLGTSIRLGVGGSNADGRPMPPHGMPTPPPVATPPRQGRAGQGRAGPANLRGEACSSCQEPGRYLRHPTRPPMMRSNNDGNNSHLEQQQRPMESTEQEGACACACIFFLMRGLQ